MHPFIIYSENDGQCGMLANLSPSPPYIFHVSPCCGGGLGGSTIGLLEGGGTAWPSSSWAKRETQACTIVVFAQISNLTTLTISAKSLGRQNGGMNYGLLPLDKLIQRGTLSLSSMLLILPVRVLQSGCTLWLTQFGGHRKGVISKFNPRHKVKGLSYLLSKSKISSCNVLFWQSKCSVQTFAVSPQCEKLKMLHCAQLSFLNSVWGE